MTAQILAFPARAVDTGERGEVVPDKASAVSLAVPVAVGDVVVVCISREPHLDIWTAWPVLSVADGVVRVLGGPSGKTVKGSELLDGRESLIFRRDDHDPAGFVALWFKGWLGKDRAVRAFAKVAL